MTTETPQSKPTPAPRRNTRVAAAVLAVAALSFGAGGIVFSHDMRTGDASVPRQTYPLSQLPAEGLRTVAAVARAATGAPPRLLEQGSPFSFADLVEHVSPAVVTVVVDRESSGPQTTGQDDIPAPFRDFFRQFGQGQGDGNGGGGGGAAIKAKAKAKAKVRAAIASPRPSSRRPWARASSSMPPATSSRTTT